MRTSEELVSTGAASRKIMSWSWPVFEWEKEWVKELDGSSCEYFIFPKNYICWLDFPLFKIGLSQIWFSKIGLRPWVKEFFGSFCEHFFSRTNFFFDWIFLYSLSIQTLSSQVCEGHSGGGLSIAWWKQKTWRLEQWRRFFVIVLLLHNFEFVQNFPPAEPRISTMKERGINFWQEPT